MLFLQITYHAPTVCHAFQAQDISMNKKISALAELTFQWEKVHGEQIQVQWRKPKHGRVASAQGGVTVLPWMARDSLTFK